MNFKEWFLKEAGSFTNSIAVFSLPLGMSSRTWPTLLNDDDEEKPKKKLHKKHKKEEE